MFRGQPGKERSRADIKVKAELDKRPGGLQSQESITRGCGVKVVGEGSPGLWEEMTNVDIG